MRTIVACNVDGVSFHTENEGCLVIGPNDFKVTGDKVSDLVVKWLARYVNLSEDEVRYQLQRSDDILSGKEYSDKPVDDWTIAMVTIDGSRAIAMSMLGAIEFTALYLKAANKPA